MLVVEVPLDPLGALAQRDGAEAQDGRGRHQRDRRREPRLGELLDGLLDVGNRFGGGCVHVDRLVRVLEVLVLGDVRRLRGEGRTVDEKGFALTCYCDLG